MLGVVGLARTYGLEVLGRHASPYLTSRNLGILQHQCTSSNDGALTHLTAVEQRRTHAYQGAVVDGAGMNSNIVSNSNIRADMRRSRLVGNMDAGAILHIGTVANSNRSHIATYHGIEPDGALVAHLHVTYNRCILTEVAVLAPLGCQTAI